MRIALGSDDEAALIPAIEAVIAEGGHEIVARFVGAAWPEVARKVGESVASGTAQRGVVCCWTGTGVSIAANKVPGVRAALCTDAATAAGARRWNDANVVALSLRLTTEALAEEILAAFLGTALDEAERELVELVEPAIDSLSRVQLDNGAEGSAGPVAGAPAASSYGALPASAGQRGEP